MDMIELYKKGNSIPEVSELTGISKSCVRYHLKKEGILRSRKEGIDIAAKKGRMSGCKGKKKIFTDEWKNNISIGKKKGADKWAAGLSLKPNGYVEITRGKHKGRGQHVVLMEEKIGRRLYSFECVHHKDFDRSNNDIDNLELMTRSNHTKLHRKLENNNRKRDKNGRFI